MESASKSFYAPIDLFIILPYTCHKMVSSGKQYIFSIELMLK